MNMLKFYCLFLGCFSVGLFGQKRIDSVEKKDSLNLIIADSLIKQGIEYAKLNNYESSITDFNRALFIYKNQNSNRKLSRTYHLLGVSFLNKGDYQNSLISFENSILFAKKDNDISFIVSNTINKGAVYYYLGNFEKAIEIYKQAIKLNQSLNDPGMHNTLNMNIGALNVELKEFDKALELFKEAKAYYSKLNDTESLIDVSISLGYTAMKKDDFLNSYKYFNNALESSIESDNKNQILEVKYNLGLLYFNQEEYEKSNKLFFETKLISKELNNLNQLSFSLIYIGNSFLKLNKKKHAINYCEEGLEVARKLKATKIIKEACACLYNAHKSANNPKLALKYYELTQAYNDSLETKKAADKILSMSFENQMLKDSIANAEQKRIMQAQHKANIAKKEKQRNIFIVFAVFGVVIATGVWSRLNYTKKAKARLQVEKDRSEHLLLNILPVEIADELKEKGFVDAQDFDSASILFTDFKSFTETASRLSPQALVEEINVCFKAFDGIIEKYQIEKIKTIGDAYMAAGGLPKPDVNAIKNTVLAALEMQDFIVSHKKENDQLEKPAFDMRLGIHVGPVVAGIVGVKKFQYDIWGDTVNIASRIESNGEVGKVNISQTTYNFIKNETDFKFEYRGKIVAKGKGEIDMYFVYINNDLLKEH